MAKTTVSLPEKFDITAVETLKGRLQKALEKDVAEVEVNAQAVATMDSAAVQLLLSFQGAVKDNGKALSIVKSSDGFNKALDLLGAASLLTVS